MRICPTCGKFGADGLSQFCAGDGSPLLDVNPHTDKWSEGERIIQEQQTVFRKAQRILRIRRVLQIAMTMTVVTMVILVTTINAIIYLKPPPPAPATANPVNPSATPDDPGPTVIASMYPVTDLGKLDDEGPNTNSNKLKPACTAADKAEIATTLLKKYRPHWDDLLKAEPPEVSVEESRKGVIRSLAKLEKISYQPTVTNCDAASFVGTSSWRFPIPGTEKAENKSLHRRFTCHRRGSAWSCP